VCFRGGSVRFVRMELWAGMVPNALIRIEIEREYVLQSFQNRTKLSANMSYKSGAIERHLSKNDIEKVSYTNEIILIKTILRN
jgi:hypothetical protein